MAIENVLERIATALETLVERGMILGDPATPGQDLSHAGEAPINLGGPKEPTDTTSGAPESRGKATSPPPDQETPTSAPLDDEDGLPWDARIHSANGTQTKDGRWKKRRGVDPALVVVVEAELRAQAAATQPTDTSPQTQAGPLDFATLQAQAHEVVRALGPRQPEVAVVLSQYGVTTLSALQQPQYEPFLASIKALVTSGPQG